MSSPAAAVAAAYHGVRAAMPLDLLQYGRNPIVCGATADSRRLPHAGFLPPLIFQQYYARGYIMPRGFAPLHNRPGRVHTTGGRASSGEMCGYVSPRFRLPTHLLLSLIHI